MSNLRINNDLSYSNNQKSNTLNLELSQTSRQLMNNNVYDDVDSYQVFLNERSSCDRYRIILTINPFCTNVLFNPCTEIVKNEGSKDVEVIDDFKRVNVENAIGKNKNLKRSDMIYNTEYSRPEIGYKYLPGLDIFDNHILRNKTFKCVTMLSDKQKHPDSFNTLSDFMRYNNGVQIKTYNRVAAQIDTELNTEPINKHLYNYEDVHSFINGDSINHSLLNQNGWFGFKNSNNLKGKGLEINRVINNEPGDAYIDMYPDRTLFSFSPKKNIFKNKLEYNWDVILTYPYENFYDHPLVTGEYGTKKINSLPILSVDLRVGYQGIDILLFRSYSKHGLKKNETIKIYVDGRLLDGVFKVYNLGNIKHDYKENYFIIDDERLINEIFKGNEDDLLNIYYNETPNIINNDKIKNKIIYFNDKLTDAPAINNKYISICKIVNGIKMYKYYTMDSNYYQKFNDYLENLDFRIVRSIGGIDNTYYIRKFKKVPNWRYSSELLTYDTAIDKDKFLQFVNKNATKNGLMYDFEHETYKLAFSNTIYGDDITQITYTDTIDIKNLYDNNGIGVHDLYMTVLKRNAGYEDWYKRKNFESDNIEFSHCFGPLTCGFNFLRLRGDNNDNINLKLKKMSFIGLYSYGDNDYPSLSKECVTCDKNDFYGDLVTCNTEDDEEIILEDIYYRFNTAQREFGDDLKQFVFTYHELYHDDYDIDGFKVNTVTKNIKSRKEGYIYKGNYRIPVRELGETNFGSRVTARVYDIKVVQDNNLYFEITTNFKHKLSSGDKIYFCNDKSKNEVESIVTDVVNSVTFRCNIISFNNLSWFNIADLVKKNEVKIRFKNYDIPDYAKKIDINKYVWRDVLHVGDSGVLELPEYPFANKSFYIDNSFNFFLLRQDPYGYNNLYYESTEEENIGDIKGNKIIENKNKYKDPDLNIVC